METTVGIRPGTESLVRPDVLGYAFHLTWICLLLYRLVPGSLNTGQASSPAEDVAYLSSMLALVATLSVGAVATKPFMRLAESLTARIGAPLLTAIGSLLLCLAPSSHAIAIIAPGGILTGVGSAVLGARWASVFGCAKSRAIINNFTLLLCIVAGLCMTSSYLPHALTCALVFVLPLSSGVCLDYARAYQSRLPRTGQLETKPSRPLTIPLAMLVVVVALIGLDSGGLLAFSESPLAGMRYDVMFYGLVTVLVLIFVGLLGYADEGTRFLPMFVAPLAVLAAIVIPFNQFVATDSRDTLYAVGNTAFELVMLFGTILFALLLDLSPARSFMVARSTLALTDFVGSAITMRLVSNLTEAASLQLASVILLCGSQLLVALLGLGYFFERRRQLPKESLEGVSGPEGAGCSTDEERDVSLKKPAGEAGTQDDAGGCAKSDNGSAPETAGLADVSAAANDECTVDEAEENPSNVSRLATDKHLSPRETEVLALLASGATPAQIQEELFISQGTMNYHMRNIYAKLGVHSRQELILLVLRGD